MFSFFSPPLWSFPAVCLMRLRARLPLGRILRPLLILLAVDLFYLALVVASAHVAANDYNPRYVIIPVLFWFAGAALVYTDCVYLLARGRIRRRLPLILYLLSLIVVCFRYGTPSLSQVRENLRTTIGWRTEDVLAAKANFVLGDYWRVWPMVFHANLVLYEQGRPPVWAITHRAGATEYLWRPLITSESIFVAAKEDSPCSRDVVPFHLPELQQAGEHNSIRLYLMAQPGMDRQPCPQE